MIFQSPAIFAISAAIVADNATVDFDLTGLRWLH
jgi:hypothetical protein